ncbi:MAG: pyridoxal-phosphate dependent enzyme [Pseudomonadota bacterium]
MKEDHPTPSLADMEATQALIAPHVVTTPVTSWQGPEVEALTGNRCEVLVKLELLQRGGTFKTRGALSNILRLSPEALTRGVTAMSAGNHAVAVAYAARAAGTHAKVVMLASASPARIKLAEHYGAELVLVDQIANAFPIAEALVEDEGRIMVHPFDGPGTALGTATVGLEFCRQAGPLDALLVAIGGGGLAAGVASAVRQLNSGCRIFGVEPEGADAMYRSFQSGQPENIGTPRSIADSLAPPMTLDYPLTLCRRHLEDIIRVSDGQLTDAMGLMFRELKLAVEPAGAAAAAALSQVLERGVEGRIGLICCGSIIDLDTYARFLGHE